MKLEFAPQPLWVAPDYSLARTIRMAIIIVGIHLPGEMNLSAACIPPPDPLQTPFRPVLQQ